MRITIVQAEIELAIKQYISTQINVKDGQEITIDFKNTRGDDGATAEINIAAPGTVPNVLKPAQPVVQTRSATPTTSITTGSSEASPAPAVAETVATTAQKETPSASVASTNSEAPAEEFKPVSFLNQEKKEPVAEATETAGAGDPPPPPSGKSLFAGLSKPVNS